MKKNQPTPLEIELAALGQLPEARQREVEACLIERGQPGLLTELAEQNVSFHQQHPALFRQVVRQHQRKQVAAPVTSRPVVWLVALAVVCLVSGFWWSRSSPRQVDPNRGASRVPPKVVSEQDQTKLIDPSFVINSPTHQCDPTKPYDALMRTSAEYKAHMEVCVAAGLLRTQGSNRALISPSLDGPYELFYACEQLWAPACYELGKYWAMPTTGRIGDGFHLSTHVNENLKAHYFYEQSCKLGSLHGCCSARQLLMASPEMRRIGRLDAQILYSAVGTVELKSCTPVKRVDLPRVFVHPTKVVMVHDADKTSQTIDVPTLPRLLKEGQCENLVGKQPRRARLQDVDSDGVLDVVLWGEQGCFAVLYGDLNDKIDRISVYGLTCPIKGDEFPIWACWGKNRTQGGVRVLLLEELDFDLKNSDDSVLFQIIHEPTFVSAREMRFEDVNFDGHHDLLIAASASCLPNQCLSTVWLFEPMRRRFVAHPKLSALPNVKVVDRGKQLFSTKMCMNDACTMFTAQLFQVIGRSIRRVAHAATTSRNVSKPGVLIYQQDSRAVRCTRTFSGQRVSGECPFDWNP